MAAPTSPRCEATSIATVDIRWVYAGSAAIAVYRSTDGTSYAEVTTVVTRVVAGTLLYEDTGLATGTKYWYKLSDDTGSTFSSVVTVWTHSCAGPVSDAASSLSLPPFLGDDGITAERLNDMQRRIEAGLAGTNVAPDACTACPVDGAIALDCSSGCINWTIVADEDINSISIDWCEPFDSTIEFIIPPNTTVGICGFPAGFGFTGDECTQAPISGGANGRTVAIGTTGGASGGSVSPGKTKSKPQTNKNLNTTSGGGAGGAACRCVPRMGGLTIKSCTADNSLACTGAKSLKLIACGGRQPYTWSRTGSVLLKGVSGSVPASTATGGSITVTPPTNSGSGEAGYAYSLQGEIDGLGAGCVCGGTLAQPFSCGDVGGSIAQGGVGSCGGVAGDIVCASSVGNPTDCALPLCPGVGGSSFAIHLQARGTPVDQRTAPMIAAGCSPCGLNVGATVSVTDAIGVVATIILRS